MNVCLLLPVGGKNHVIKEIYFIPNTVEVVIRAFQCIYNNSVTRVIHIFGHCHIIIEDSYQTTKPWYNVHDREIRNGLYLVRLVFHQPYNPFLGLLHDFYIIMILFILLMNKTFVDSLQIDCS